MNYEKDMHIDESSLDVELLEQPSIMIRYAQKAAEARLERDRQKERVDVVKAELDRDIRTNPDKYGIEKLTETVVSNTILLQEEYQTAVDEYLTLKYESEVLQGAVNAVDQRKDALENLVRLHGLQYFAGPKVPRNLSDERQYREEQQKKVDAGVAKKLMIRRTRNE